MSNDNFFSDAMGDLSDSRSLQDIAEACEKSDYVYQVVAQLIDLLSVEARTEIITKLQQHESDVCTELYETLIFRYSA